MIELTYCPRWFYGRDIVIDVISMLVLLLIVIFAFSSYRIGKNKKYLWLSFAFTLLSLSFLAKILMNFTVYNEVVETQKIGYAIFTYERIMSSDNLFFLGHLLYRIMTILGLYTLFAVYLKSDTSSMILTSVFAAAAIYYSSQYNYVFFMMCFIITAMITLVYIKNNFSRKNRKTALLAASFAVITLSQLVAVFISLNIVLYAISELIQLVGYLGLLFTYMMVLYGKETVKDRHN